MEIEGLEYDSPNRFSFNLLGILENNLLINKDVEFWILRTQMVSTPLDHRMLVKNKSSLWFYIPDRVCQ